MMKRRILSLIIVLFGILKLEASDTLVYISDVEIEGNDITQEDVILRELTFHVNDSILLSALREQMIKSKENLLNTSLFNFVNIEFRYSKLKMVKISVIVEERWYLWPNPIIESADRNFSSFVKNKNWDRINYGMYFIYNNFRGRKEILRLKARFGYKEQFGLFYENPGIGYNRKHGFTLDLSYFRKHESDVKTINNQIVEYKDPDKYLWKSLSVSGLYSYRPEHYNKQIVKFEYDYQSIDDTIAKYLNPNYYGGGNNNIKLLSLTYQFKRDKRDSRIYPLKGYYFDFYLRKSGFFGLSDYSNLKTKVLFSWHDQLAGKFYYSTGIKFQASSHNYLPYFENQALGYSDYLHGLEHFVIDGPHFILSKNNLKYQLMSPRTDVLRYVPFKKFNKVHYAMYLNLFVDLGYVPDVDRVNLVNPMNGSFLNTYSVGYDFVTYYDQTLRFEYSWNKFYSGFLVDITAAIFKEN